MRCVRVTTRVTTAQSIITKVNKSLYVTICTSSFHSVRQLAHRPLGPLGKYIIMVSLLYINLTQIFTNENKRDDKNEVRQKESSACLGMFRKDGQVLLSEER